MVLEDIASQLQSNMAYVLSMSRTVDIKLYAGSDDLLHVSHQALLRKEQMCLNHGKGPPNNCVEYVRVDSDVKCDDDFY